MKVLNLYAGIGGNRKLWPKDIEVTAIEWIPEIANIYKDFFPNDKIIITDAHSYLLKHFKEFDFIWSSPPCPTHSRFNTLNNTKVELGIKPKYPDMKLYEEIILLNNWFKGKYCVENVISYYDPLIIPYNRGNHYFWSNFYIPDYIIHEKRGIREGYKFMTLKRGFDLSNYHNLPIKKVTLLNNCVEPELGLHIWEAAFKGKQLTIS